MPKSKVPVETTGEVGVIVAPVTAEGADLLH